MTTLTQWFI